MFYIGIDIGSTSAKTAVLSREGEILYHKVIPTGWSSVKTAETIKEMLESEGFPIVNSKVVATGYGRISVPYAHKAVTEITCHGKGAAQLFGGEGCTVIDIGGQDTKVITLENNLVTDFMMNDKCSAGTGRFLEIMANILGVDIAELCHLAFQGKDVHISSMCTVFAESEVISLIGKGESKENIAYGILESITEKVATLCSKHTNSAKQVYLTGGLCEIPYVLDSLSKKIGKPVESSPMARYAGAIGAAIMAKKV